MPPFFLIIFLNYNHFHLQKYKFIDPINIFFSILPPPKNPAFPYPPVTTGNNENTEAEFNKHADSLIRRRAIRAAGGIRGNIDSNT